jgi:hypothetical protein
VTIALLYWSVVWLMSGAAVFVVWFVARRRQLRADSARRIPHGLSGLPSCPQSVKLKLAPSPPET